MKRYLFILMVLLLTVGCMVIPTAAADTWNAVFTPSSLDVNPAENDTVTIIGGFSKALDVSGYSVTVKSQSEWITVKEGALYEYIIDSDSDTERPHSLFYIENDIAFGVFDETLSPSANCFVYTFKISENAPSDAVIPITFHMSVFSGNYNKEPETRDYTVNLYLPEAKKPCVHNSLEYVAEVAPLCNASGTAAHYKCIDCKMLFSDAEGKNKIDKPAVINRDMSKPKNHSDETYIDGAKSATSLAEGYTGDTRCSLCKDILIKGEIIPVICDHNTLTKVPGKASTCTVQGNEEYYKCSNPRCEVIFSDSKGEHQISQPPMLDLNRDNHINPISVDELPPTDTEPGYSNATYCNDCRQILEYKHLIPPTLAVVQIGDKFFDSFSEALTEAKSGDTVVICADVDENMVMIPSGVTLDLNGKTFDAQYVASFGDIVDNSTDKTGLLKVADKGLMLAKDNAQLPVWDSQKGGYAFTVITFNQMMENVTVNSTTLRFKPNKDPAITNIICEAAQSGHVTIEVVLTWGGNNLQAYVYSTEQAKGVFTKGTLTLTINGINNKKFDDLKVQARVISDTDVIKYGKVMDAKIKGEQN